MNSNSNLPQVDRSLDPTAPKLVNRAGSAVVADIDTELNLLIRECVNVSRVRERLTYVILVCRHGANHPREAAWLDQAMRLARASGCECIVVQAKNYINDVREYCVRMDIRVLFVQHHYRLFVIRDRSLFIELCRADALPPVFVIRSESRQIRVKARPTFAVELILQISALLIVATICFLTQSWLPEAFQVLLFILTLALTTNRVSVFVGVIGSFVGAFLYTAIHSKQGDHLGFAEPGSWLVFLAVVGVSLAITSLSYQQRESLRESRDRAKRQTTFHALASSLLATSEVSKSAQIASDHIASIFENEVEVFVRQGGTTRRLVHPEVFVGGDTDTNALEVCLSQQIESGFSTATFSLAEGTYIPIPGRSADRACLCVYSTKRVRSYTQEQLRILHSYAALLGQNIERIRIEREKQEVESRSIISEARATLFRGVSHDLMTPITTINGYAAQLLDNPGIDLNERLSRYQTIREEAARLENSVENLLAVTKLDSRNDLPSKDELYVEEVLGTAASQARRKHSERSIKVKGCPDDLMINADASLINQALLNLVDNACKYSENDKPIFLEAIERDGQVRISVIDQGIGIPTVDQDRIFDRYTRLETSNASEGTGLGLAIVKQIVTLHDGQIEVESAVGKGATFTIVLPAVALSQEEI